jgi:hypothetical protein
VKAFEFARRTVARIAAEVRKMKNSLFFSLLAGNSALEMGSTATACATNDFNALSPLLGLGRCVDRRYDTRNLFSFLSRCGLSCTSQMV